MRANIKVELTDEERNQVAIAIRGKPTKAMVTRAQLTEMVGGFLEGIISAEKNPEPETVTHQVSKPATRRVYPITAQLEKMLAKRGYIEGHPKRIGYIRGYYAVKNR